MTRATVSHSCLVGLLLAILILAAGLPGWAAYTKLYRIQNTMGEDGQFLRVISNALEVVTTYTAYPLAWSPPAISNIVYGGTYCTKLKFGEFRVDPVVAPGAYAKIGWRTADNNCRLRDLRWVKYSGATVPVVDPDQLGGVPGGGEVRYDAEAGEYVWLIINDTGSTLRLSDVSIQVYDEEPPLAQLMGEMWPQALMRTMANGDDLPDENIVAQRVQNVIDDHVQPLIALLTAARDAGYLSPDDWWDLVDKLQAGVEAGLSKGDEVYPGADSGGITYRQYWDYAVQDAEDFKALVEAIQAKMPVIGTASADWSSWWGGSAPGAMNEHGVIASYSRIVANQNHAYVWDSRLGDAGFVELQDIRPDGMAPGGQSIAFNIDNHGRIAGDIYPATGPQRGVVWVPDASAPEGYVAVDMPPPPLPGYSSYTRCRSINDNGLVVCFCRYEPTRRYDTYLMQLNPDNTVDFVRAFDYGTSVYGYDINNAGQICGYYYSGNLLRPFRLDPVGGGNYTAVALSVPADATGHCYALRLSEEGHVAGYAFCASGMHALAWKNDGASTLVDTWTTPLWGWAAYDANSDGDVIGGTFAWNIAGPQVVARNVSPSAWHGSWAWGITDSGLVGGEARLSNTPPYNVFVGRADVLPYVLPDGLSDDWLAAADALIAAIVDDPEDPEDAYLPGDPVASIAEFESSERTEEYTDTTGETRTAKTLEEATNPETGEVVIEDGDAVSIAIPDDDHVQDETVVMRTGVRPPASSPAMMRTAQVGEYVLECIEMYTPEEGVRDADTTPPTIDHASITPETLWPPNHKMVDMAFDVQVSDVDNDGLPRDATWYIESVSSSQPINGDEDGNTAPDWLIDPEDQRSLQLRAERAGDDPAGRTYTVVIRAIDGDGNRSAPHSLQVHVPLNQGETEPAMTIASLAAASAGGRAVEVVFTLSSEAQVEVEVLNIAGRRVRTIVADRECEAGINSLAWNCRSDRGVMVPSGAYLVRVTARTEDGEQAGRLCTVMLRR